MAYSPDGVHYTTQGYDILGSVIFAAFVVTPDLNITYTKTGNLLTFTNGNILNSNTIDNPSFESGYPSQTRVCYSKERV